MDVLHTTDSIALMGGIGSGIDGMLYQMDENSLEILRLEPDELSDFMESQIMWEKWNRKWNKTLFQSKNS